MSTIKGVKRALFGFPGTVAFTGLDYVWRRSENPDEHWTWTGVKVMGEGLLYSMLGPTGLALVGANAAMQLGGVIGGYYRDRQVNRHHMLMKPNLGGHFSGFQMNELSFNQQAYGLRSIQEASRGIGAALGQEAYFYHR